MGIEYVRVRKSPGIPGTRERDCGNELQDEKEKDRTVLNSKKKILRKNLQLQGLYCPWLGHLGQLVEVVGTLFPNPLPRASIWTLDGFTTLIDSSLLCTIQRQKQKSAPI